MKLQAATLPMARLVHNCNQRNLSISLFWPKTGDRQSSHDSFPIANTVCSLDLLSDDNNYYS